METVEVVIRIPKKYIEGSLFNGIEKIMKAVREGTVLPKGHGRLVDAREYENSIRKHYFDNSTVIRCTEIALDNAETIIEADKEADNE